MQHPTPPMNKEKLSQLMDGEWHELNPSDCVAGVCGDDALRGKWARYHLIRDVMKNEESVHSPAFNDEQLVSRICAAIADEPAYSNVTAFNSADAGEPMGSEQTTTATSIHSATDETVATVDEKLSADDVSPARAQDQLTQGQRAQGQRTRGQSDTVVNLPAQERARPSLFGTGLAGFALAASVALVTVIGMNVWQGQTPDASVSAVGAVAVNNTAGTSATVIDGSNAFSQQVEGAPLPVVDFVGNTGSYWVSPQTAERVDDEVRLNMLLSQHIENSPTSSREGLLPYSRLVGYDERGAER